MMAALAGRVAHSIVHANAFVPAAAVIVAAFFVVPCSKGGETVSAGALAWPGVGNASSSLRLLLPSNGRHSSGVLGHELGTSTLYL